MIASPQQVLGFWFGRPAADHADLTAKLQRWFGGGPGMDREVTERFAATLEAALGGELDAWAVVPRERLALVLILDQFSRNVLRDQVRMYAGDENAQRLARETFEQELDIGLDYPERLFLSMPLLHSEDLRHHDQLASIAAQLAKDAPSLYAPMVAMHSEQRAKYRDVIAHFGRFPHRNAVLGRTSTDEEKAFLVDWESKAPPRAMPATR